MIEKRRRITRSIFKTESSRRFVLRGDFITMTHYQDNSIPRSRFTVVVSKKIAKLAVERNSIKRWVYEAVRSRERSFDEKFRGVIVFSLNKTGTQIVYKDIARDIAFFLENPS